MPARKERKSAPPVSVADRIGDLPDCILQHVLSFLPVQAAVRTCVLARRWCDLWRTTTGLRIVNLHDENLGQIRNLQKFVDHLLILRERTDLETVEIKFGHYLKDDVSYVNLWIRFAVMCKVRALTLHVSYLRLHLHDRSLVSQHLRTLDLYGLVLEKNILDFANCPALENVKMNFCEIYAARISSRSLKHLSITDCRSDLVCRFRVSTPGLLSLKLVGFFDRAPFLENMAFLESACVHISEYCRDFCRNYDYGVFCGANNNACANCAAKIDGSSDCVLLGGMSSAIHLELQSYSGKFIFTRDLKHCPIFSKLKTLLLNEYWCEAPDFFPLACILKKSPVLEKLTLQIFSMGPNHKVEIKGCYSTTERSSAISEHLNIVEIKCNVVNEKILKVMKFLKAFNIGFPLE